MNVRKCGLAAVKRCDNTLNAVGGGYDDFLSRSHLDKYLRGTNTLRIRIARIEVY